MHISYSFGIVDLLHFGHVNALKKAKTGADLHVFGLVSDQASSAWLGTHVSNESERRAVLESSRYIDEVWDQSTFDPLPNLQKLHTQYPEAEISLFSGNEWSILAAEKFIQSIGGKIVKLDYYDKLSPQAILDTLKSDDSRKAPLISSIISTKANTLQALKPKLTKARIEDLFILTIADFNHKRNEVFQNVQHLFGTDRIVVRSSSKREDAFEASNAGHFTSVLNVPANDPEAVGRAIHSVIDSYGENPEEEEQVLIQRQTHDVMASGVVFTRDIQRNRPYYVINYDQSGSTDSVTSGAGGMSAWISHQADRANIPAKWASLMNAVWELENILSGVILDIEFALTPQGVVIFQVRPLAAAYKFNRKTDSEKSHAILDQALGFYERMQRQRMTCFSDMAFWNPAEIIGDNPMYLDYSLYREIITKAAWDEGLVPMGYRQVAGELMFRFGNKPYINVERSFEALIPATVPEPLAEKLKLYYVEKLKTDLSAHDKIEFEISHNCFDFSLSSRLQRLAHEGFTAEEVATLDASLRTLTRKIIMGYEQTLKADEHALKALESTRLDIQSITANCTDAQILAKSVRTLLFAIMKFGTPQFARQARCAFIAKSLGRSLVRERFLDAGTFEHFWSSIKTVAVDYDRDYKAVARGSMSADEFDRVYGHLRAGTYNIRSPRYDAMALTFAEQPEQKATPTVPHSVLEEFDKQVAAALTKALATHSLADIPAETVVQFMRCATEQRERFKFIFTRSLSLAIELIKRIGAVCGIEPEDLSYLELPEIYAAKYYSSVHRMREFWSLIIRERKVQHRDNSELILPSVICSDQDLLFIENMDTRPNFITEAQVEGEVAVLDTSTSDDIKGKIVVIEKADPGYDWIFAKSIAGLVTKYGGVASHMAIRCAEFKIPAAIGCGAKLFEYASSAERLSLDCHNGVLKKL